MCVCVCVCDTGSGQKGVEFMYTVKTTEPTTLLKLPRSALFYLQSESIQAIRDNLVQALFSKVLYIMSFA